MLRLPFSLSICIALILLSLSTISCDKQTETHKVEKAAMEPSSAEEGVLFKRSNFVVADIDRSLTVYRDILGFSVFGTIEESSEDSYSYPVFKIPKEAKIRFVALNSPSQERTLALTEVSGIELPKPQTPLMSGVVIRVDDLATTIKQVQNLKLETTEIKVVESPRINYKEQAFLDFDGHLIVLYETF